MNNVAMGLEVIGAGLPRTGTESLKFALELLGFGPCYHMVEVIEHPEHLPAWEAAARGDTGALYTALAGYRAAVDFPAVGHWRTLIERYPAAHVILTLRDPAAWFTSFTNTIAMAVMVEPENDVPTLRRRHMVRRDLIDGFFCGRAADEAFMRAAFEQHAREVRAALPAARLLEFEVRDGWPPLCEFLGVPVPAVDFPRGNSTAEFRDKYIGEAP